LRSLAEVTNVEAELQDVDLFKLMMVFEKVLKRFEAEKNKPVHQVVQYPYTVEAQKKFLLDEVSTRENTSFSDIVEKYPTRVAMIFTFLAILELLALQQLSIRIGEGYNNFWLSKGEATGDRIEMPEAPSDEPGA